MALLVLVWILSICFRLNLQIFHDSYSSNGSFSSFELITFEGSLLVNDRSYAPPPPPPSHGLVNPLEDPNLWGTSRTGWNYRRDATDYNVLFVILDTPTRGHSITAPIFGVLGFAFEPSSITVGIPLWIFAIFYGIFPSLALMRSYKIRRMRSRGLCCHCGYDIRATPEQCPECGQKVQS